MQRSRFAALVLSATVLLAACSSDKNGTASTTTRPAGGTTTSMVAVDRPAGPAAKVVRELTGKGGPFMGALTPAAGMESARYVEHEYEVSGSAVSYEAKGELTADGRWNVQPTTDKGDYRTRIVVRRPSDAAKANGTVLVEWLNVSGGIDANPDYAYTEAEILRGGYTWVGVSAQSIGIEGGPVAVPIAPDNPLVSSVSGKGLKKIDPARYGELSHPGDQFSYDMYTQIARALRSDDGTVLGGIRIGRMLAIGESQSAFALTTYANGIQPLTEEFDGFLIHSRGGAPLPLSGGDRPNIDIASAIIGTPTRIRTDLRAPVLMAQSESDVVGVLNFLPARQPDSDTVHTWEMAGTAHVDKFLIGAVADSFDCGVAINAGPANIILKAALRSLDAWVRNGTPPPSAKPFETEQQEGETRYVRDDHGIVLGGVRTPPVDVPTEILSGTPGPSSNIICMLTGSTIPMTPTELGKLYESAKAYEAKYAKSADAAIEAGFVLTEDRKALMDMSQPDLVGKG